MWCLAKEPRPMARADLVTQSYNRSCHSEFYTARAGHSFGHDACLSR
jgi:hypothetical protein